MTAALVLGGSEPREAASASNVTLNKSDATDFRYAKSGQFATSAATEYEADDDQHYGNN